MNTRHPFPVLACAVGILLAAYLFGIRFRAHKFPTIASKLSDSRTQNGALIASFEGGLLPFDGVPKESFEVVNDHATEGHSALRWSGGGCTADVEQDWSQFDSLLIDSFNSSSDFVQMVISVKDNESIDYWSRVNYPVAVAPGKTTIKIPTHLYVGEKSRPGRPLNINKIRWIAFDRPGDVSATVLYLDNVRLIKEPIVKKEGVLAFDFGTYDSPIFAGMRRVVKEDQYSKERGYGFRDASIWSPYSQASDALQPDALYRDSTMIEVGKFIVDVPKNGRYKVFMNLDHAGGYWGEYPIYRKRRVFAQGKLVVDENQDMMSAANRYFSFFSFDDYLNDDVFERYQPILFQEKEFEVEIMDQTLELAFPAENCREGACFHMALSTLIIGPSDDESTYRDYLAWVRAKRKEEFNDNFKKYIPATNTGSELSSLKELSLFTRSTMDEISENSIPSAGEIDHPVEVSAAQGESETLSFAMLPNKDLGVVKIEVSELSGPGIIAKEAVHIGIVSNRITRMNADGTLYGVSERYVRDTTEVELKKGDVARVWSTLSVPEGTPPGRYTGKFRVTGEKIAEHTLPISVVVYKFALDQVDIPIGPFNSTVLESFWFPAETQSRAAKLSELSLQKMRQVGLTAFSTSPNIKVISSYDGEIRIDASQFDVMMDHAKELGFKSVVGYLEIISGFSLCNSDSKSFYSLEPKDFYRQFAALVSEHAEAKGWLPVKMIVCDEPLDGEVDRISNLMTSLNAMPSELVQYSVTFSANSKAKASRLLSELPFSFLNQFDDSALKQIADSKKSFAFYNRPYRDTFGFYLYRLKTTASLGLRLAWNWNQNAGNPYYPFDGREDDYNWCNSTPDGDLMCTVFLDRHIREGLDDYRYALTLDRVVSGLKDPLLAARGRKLVEEVKAFVPSAEPVPGKNSLSVHTAEALRTRIGEFLDESSGEPKM